MSLNIWIWKWKVTFLFWSRMVTFSGISSVIMHSVWQRHLRHEQHSTHCWHQFPFFFFFGKLFIDVLFLCWIELASAAHASLNRAEVGSAGVQLGQKSALTVPLCGRAHRKRMWNALLRPKDWVCVGISLQLIQRYTHCNAICLFLCGCLLTDPVCYTALCTLCSSQYV